MESGLAHLPLLPLMQSQEDIFHTETAEKRPGCDHLAQTTKLCYFLNISVFYVLNSWTFVFVSCAIIVCLEPAL